MNSDITLQINLSAGDINYADIMVRDLVSKHTEVKETLLIVDCCKPQRTKSIDPLIKYPEPEYSSKIKKIKNITNKLLQNEIVDNVYLIEQGDPLLKKVAKKYINTLFSETHDAKGTPVLSYLLPLELITTRYMVHYDADMLLYQKEGCFWTLEAIKIMIEYDNAIFATPRVAPPFADLLNKEDATSLHEGPIPNPVKGGWLINWFSTRCFLIDNYKFNKLLPLMDTSIYLELILRKIFQRSFPMATEMLLHKSLGKRGYRRLDLNSEDYWLLHPEEKDEKYISNLTKLLDYISRDEIPDEQRGWENMKSEIWENLLIM